MPTYLDGGVGGLSSNCTKVPNVTAAQAIVITEKYCASPSADVAILPPTRNAVAIPIWLKFNAIAVDVARSSDANHVADNMGGVHWKNGCAAPTKTVPARTLQYGTRPAADDAVSAVAAAAKPQLHPGSRSGIGRGS